MKKDIQSLIEYIFELSKHTEVDLVWLENMVQKHQIRMERDNVEKDELVEKLELILNLFKSEGFEEIWKDDIDTLEKAINVVHKYNNEHELFNRISEYIIKEVQEKSILTGFQYIVDFNCVKEKFNIDMNAYRNMKIMDYLSAREEVTDVQLDKLGFDVVLGIAYAPNYQEHE